MRPLAALILILAACGAKAKPPGGGDGADCCARGEYFMPGCTDEPGMVAGCYVRCAQGCPDGTACGTVSVTPACALGSGAACDACAEDVELCLPSETGD